MMWTWEVERVLHSFLQAAPGLGLVLLAALIAVPVLRRRPLAGVSLLLGLATYAAFEIAMPVVELALDVLVFDVAGLRWTAPLATGMFAVDAFLRALGYAGAVALTVAAVFLARRLPEEEAEVRDG